MVARAVEKRVNARMPMTANRSIEAGIFVAAATAAAAALAWIAQAHLAASSLALAFVAPIVLSAIRYGLWASLASALLSTLLLNFLFVEPRFTFVIARAQDVAALALFAVVGVLVSAIAAQARDAAIRAEERARIAGHLQAFASRLAVRADETDIADAAVAVLAEVARRRAILINATDEGGDFDAREAAHWAIGTKQPLLAGAASPLAAPWSFWPILFAGRSEAALGVYGDEPLAPELSRAVEQIAAQTAIALDRARQARIAEAARREVENERMKAELLAGVSHDLRTPLSTIVFTLQSLQRFATTHDAATQADLLALAEQEARRLADLVERLLDAARIEAGATPVHLDVIAPSDIIAAATSEHRFADVAFDVASDLPAVRADPVLAVRALANVIANAFDHGGGAQVSIAARRADAGVAIEVNDRGGGIGGDPARLFRKFVRGAEGDGRPPGLGLGLSLARSFMEAQGGALTAYNREGGGASFVLRFALADEPVHAG